MWLLHEVQFVFLHSLNFCSFFFIDFGIDLTEFLEFEIFFCQVLETKKFYLVVVF